MYFNSQPIRPTLFAFESFKTYPVGDVDVSDSDAATKHTEMSTNRKRMCCDAMGRADVNGVRPLCSDAGRQLVQKNWHGEQKRAASPAAPNMFLLPA